MYAIFIPMLLRLANVIDALGFLFSVTIGFLSLAQKTCRWAAFLSLVDVLSTKGGYIVQQISLHLVKRDSDENSRQLVATLVKG